VSEVKPTLLVAIDTASEQAGVALCEGGVVIGSVTWQTRQNHSRELLPSLEWLLERHNRDKSQIGAFAVTLGPGSYAGLRVGVSTAKALAYGLDASLVGVGRLAADALPLALAGAGRIVPIQAAGRGELAWAVYRASGDGGLIEVVEPRLGKVEELATGLDAGDVICGDADRLDERARAELTGAGGRIVSMQASRVLAVASLGWRRLQRGEIDNPDTLVPLYLRPPAIGPQPPR
jgi:tRNA threonylcarbamoyladenosine biosynthesis protein TsaB